MGARKHFIMKSCAEFYKGLQSNENNLDENTNEHVRNLQNDGKGSIILGSFQKNCAVYQEFHVLYCETELVEYRLSKRKSEHLAKSSVHFSHTKSNIPNL
jgi:hypothetical protein